MLYYFFTMNDLKAIDKKLKNFITFEAKIYQMEKIDKTISIKTS